MKKTLTGLLEQDLKETNSEYTYDKAHNIITIGSVELLLVKYSRPGESVRGGAGAS